MNVRAVAWVSRCAPRTSRHRAAVLAWFVPLLAWPLLVLVRSGGQARPGRAVLLASFVVGPFASGPLAGVGTDHRTFAAGFAIGLPLSVLVYAVLARTSLGTIPWPFVTLASLAWHFTGIGCFAHAVRGV